LSARAVPPDATTIADGLAELRRDLIRRDVFGPYAHSLDELLTLADDLVARLELDAVFGAPGDGEAAR
jgi:hypothetical protein